MYGVAERDSKRRPPWMLREIGSDALSAEWFVLDSAVRRQASGIDRPAREAQASSAPRAAMTQIPLSIEQTVAAQPKRSTATKLVVGLLAGFAVVCVYQNGHQRRVASRVAVSPLHLADRVEMRVWKCT